MDNLFSFPWEAGEKPYFVNDDGFEWYIDKDSTKYCYADMADGTKSPLKEMGVGCFFVKKDKYISRVMIDKNQNILADETSWEGLLYKIDFLKLAFKK
jgi:hypothetical protein